MRYVFGPVPSSRLGRSLGIDPLPFKTCNWNCVYCQLGRTRRLTNDRRSVPPVGELLAEFEEALERCPPGTVDWVTIVGAGEPLLYGGLGALVRGVKARTDLPLALITNGSLFSLPEVRSEVQAVDAVLPSLDCGTSSLFRRVNRPHRDLSFEDVFAGLLALREEFRGSIWVEVMLVKELNDSLPALLALADRLRELRPDVIHINVPTRPPAEPWVWPPDAFTLGAAVELFGSAAALVGRPPVRTQAGGASGSAEAVLTILARHPMTESDLRQNLSWSRPEELSTTLETLRAAGELQVVTRENRPFWTVACARYG